MAAGQEITVIVKNETPDIPKWKCVFCIVGVLLFFLGCIYFEFFGDNPLYILWVVKGYIILINYELLRICFRHLVRNPVSEDTQQSGAANGQDN